MDCSLRALSWAASVILATLVALHGEPAAGLTATPSPTPAAVCTPPLCLEGEVFHCPDICPGGCGTICATPTPARSICEGDCDGNWFVSVAELIRAVSIALGQQSADLCEAVDLNRDGIVSINELVAAVRRALDGCADGFADFVGVFDLPDLNPAPRLAVVGRIRDEMTAWILYGYAESIFLRGIVTPDGRVDAEGTLTQGDIVTAVEGMLQLERSQTTLTVLGEVQETNTGSGGEIRFRLDRPRLPGPAFQTEAVFSLSRMDGSRSSFTTTIELGDSGLTDCGAATVRDDDTNEVVATIDAARCMISPGGVFVWLSAWDGIEDPFLMGVSFFGELAPSGSLFNASGTAHIGVVPGPVETVDWIAGSSP